MVEPACEWRWVNPSDLRADPGTYSFSWPTREQTAALARSLRAFGVLTPLIAVRGQAGLTVASGWRRLRLLGEEGCGSVPVRVADAEGPALLWELLLEDRLLAGPLNPVELGLYAQKRLAATGEDLAGLTAVCGRVGLPEKPGAWDDFLWIAGLPDPHRDAFAEGRLAGRGVRVLSRGPRDDALAVLDLLGTARVGVNKFGELARWILECAWREGKAARRWLEEEGLSGGGDPERLRREVRRRRFPTVVDWEASFRRDCERARLPDDVRLSHPPGFEGGRLSCTLSFSTLEGLRELASDLIGAVDGGRLDPLRGYLE